MNSSETQSDSSSRKTYFDPEAMDTSEQEFSASLEASPRSSFVVDSPESSTAKAQPANFPEDMDSAENLDKEEETENVERRAPRPFVSVPDDAAVSSEGDNPCLISDNEPSTSDWRDQVSAKVKHYKTLKPRKARYPSLQLQFDTVVPFRTETSPLAAEREQFLASARSEAAPAIFESEPRISYPASTDSSARLLEFPRPGTLPFNRDELAEPVIDRPRIVEAPELLPPPPALGGIMIESAQEPEPERQPGVDMPLQTAQLSRRVFAGAIDALFVLGATAIFGYMFLRFNSSLPQMRVAVEVAAALTVILWFAYEGAFLIFCGTTPGLRLTRLNISRFDGGPVSRNLRRWRVVASVLSFASLGLGYVWTFLDEDQLSWHDRITKTHLAPRK
jgi:uncharacterized RDD family membrane protein YckC